MSSDNNKHVCKGDNYTGFDVKLFHLLCKSMDWFLYDNGLLHERVNKML